MALIGNITALSRFPGRFIGGSTLSGERCNFNQSGSARNQFTAFSPKGATPNGYTPPYSWIIPKSSGGLSSYNRINGSGSLNAPELQLIISVSANISGSGAITTPVVQATIPVSASISASGDFAASTVQAIGNLSADITPFTGITPDNIASAVWESPQSSFEVSGTMGAQMKNALKKGEFIALK